MGLDIVEIFMRAEEEFGIDIPNDQAAAADTVGKLYNLVLEKLQSRNPAAPVDPDAVWRKLRALIVDQLQVDEEDVTMHARWNEDLGAD